MSDKQSELTPKFSEEIDPQAQGSVAERPNFVPLGSIPVEKATPVDAPVVVGSTNSISARRIGKLSGSKEPAADLKPHQVTRHYVNQAQTLLGDRRLNPHDAKQLFNDLKERFQTRSLVT